MVAKLKVVHKWVGLNRIQSFMLLLGRVGLGHFTCWVGSIKWATSISVITRSVFVDCDV